jgi:hypothetical protein
MRDLNLCLLGSWAKRLIMDENRLWRGIIEENTTNRDIYFYVDNKHSSPF